MKIRITTDLQTIPVSISDGLRGISSARYTPPVIAEISAKSTADELTAFRQGITKAATEKEWEAVAVAFFASLRARGARYEVRTLGRR